MALKPYPLPAVVDPVMEIILKGTLADGGGGSKKCENVFYYRLTTQNNPPLKASLKAAFLTTVITPLIAAAVDRYVPNRGIFRFINDVADLPTSISIAGTGAIATDSAASTASIVVNLLSATRGKMCRGSKKFGGLAEAHTTKDLLSGGGLTLWEAVRDACKAVLTDADGNIWTPCVLSRTLSQLAVNPTTAVYNDVTAVLVNQTIGTMNSRKVRGSRS